MSDIDRNVASVIRNASGENVQSERNQRRGSEAADSTQDTRSSVSDLLSSKSTRRTRTNTSKKSHRSSSSSSDHKKFSPETDGHQAFLLALTRLGKGGREVNWHDVRKLYHKDTNRQLTVDELNAIFSTKNLTKHELFDLPGLRDFIRPVEGSRLQRFSLNMNGLQSYEIKRDDTGHTFLTLPSPASHASDTASSSEDHSNADSPNKESTNQETNDIKEGEPNEEKKADAQEDVLKDQKHAEIEEVKIAIPSNEGVGDICATSDMTASYCSESNSRNHGVLSNQESLHSTDDEGWHSGKEVRSANVSPVESVGRKEEPYMYVEREETVVTTWSAENYGDLAKNVEIGPNEVFEENPLDKSGEGGMNSKDVADELAKIFGGEKIGAEKIVVGDEPRVEGVESIVTVEKVTSVEKASESSLGEVQKEEKSAQETIKKVLEAEKQASIDLTSEEVVDVYQADGFDSVDGKIEKEDLSPAPIRDLIAKFELPTTPTLKAADSIDVKHAPEKNLFRNASQKSSPGTSIYARLIDEFGETSTDSAKQVLGVGPMSSLNVFHVEDVPVVIETTGKTLDKSPEGTVIFRSHHDVPQTKPRRKFLDQDDVDSVEEKRNEELEEFTAAHVNKSFGLAFSEPSSAQESPVSAAKQQESMTSLERDYFASRSRVPDDIFEKAKSVDAAVLEKFLEKLNEPAESDEKVNDDEVATNSITEDVITVVERFIGMPSDDILKPGVGHFQLGQEGHVRKVSIGAMTAESEGDIPYSLCTSSDEEDIVDTILEKSQNKTLTNEKGGNTINVEVELDPKARKVNGVGNVSAEQKEVDGMAALDKTQELETSQLDARPDQTVTHRDGAQRKARLGRAFGRSCCTIN